MTESKNHKLAARTYMYALDMEYGGDTNYECIYWFEGQRLIHYPRPSHALYSLRPELDRIYDEIYAMDLPLKIKNRVHTVLNIPLIREKRTRSGIKAHFSRAPIGKKCRP